MKDVMLDLETFGLQPGSVIRSIGAVFFDYRGATGAEFYANIDQQSCLERGLTIDPKTAAWWAAQSLDAQADLDANPLTLGQVAADFKAWFSALGGERVWANGAAFDPVLWEAAVGPDMLPWKYWNVLDTRTVKHLFPIPPDKQFQFSGTPHNAIDDCKHQIKQLVAALRQGREPEEIDLRP